MSLRDSSGTGPARTRRRALANSRKASGSSTSTAETILVVKPREPKSSVTSNHASHTSSVAVMIMQKMTTWRWCQAAQAVAANPRSSATSSPTHTVRQSSEV